MPPFIRSCFFTTTTTTTTITLSFSRFATGLISSFVILSPPPRNCNVARSVCLHNFLHFRVARLPSYPIPSLSLFPDPSSPIYVYLFLFIFNVSSVWQAAYSDFVSSRSRESSCHFSFPFFFSNLLELSSPNPSSPLVGNYICIRSPRGEDRDLTSF